MLFKNANIFVGGQFQHGSFRVENGRFAEILTTVPDEDGTGPSGAVRHPSASSTCITTAIPVRIFQTAIMPASSKWHAILQKMA